MSDEAFICYTSCHICKQHLKIEFYHDKFETRENVTFLGRLGSETISYCPYCGAQQTGFSPYDPKQKMDMSLEQEPVESEFDDPEEWDGGTSWWPDAEGVTLIDEDEGDDILGELEEEKALFVCSHCGEKFRVNPKGCEKIFCYYCGEKI